MAELEKAITSAAKILISAIEGNYPETDCRLLPRKIKELVNSAISAQSVSLVNVIASDVAPKLNVSADSLACAHMMYVSGDKTNALRMVMHAFEQPDCVALMTSLSELNEETDPSDLDVVISRINKGEEDDGDTNDRDDDEILYGDNVPPTDVTPPASADDPLIGNPALKIDEMQDSDLDDTGAQAPYGDFADYDMLNQGVPPDSIQVLRNVLSGDFNPGELAELLASGNMTNLDEDLGDEDYGGNNNTTDSGYSDNYAFAGGDEPDVVPGYDDNQLSNVSTDPATDVEWNPANWDLDDDRPTRGDPMNFDFDDMAAVNPGMTDMNGIDNTVSGDPRNASDTSALDQTFGLTPSLNPSQSIIAKITDKTVLAAINILSAKKDKETQRKLNAFINLYCAKQGIN